MAVTEAHKRASKKYDDKTYKIITTKFKKNNAEIMDLYIAKNNIKSRQSFIIDCVNYCINNNINPSI